MEGGGRPLARSGPVDEHPLLARAHAIAGYVLRGYREDAQPPRTRRNRSAHSTPVSDTPNLSSAALEQWTLFGGHWRLIEIAERFAVVELCACTGEPVQRLRTEVLATVAYLRDAGENSGETEAHRRN